MTKALRVISFASLLSFLSSLIHQSHEIQRYPIHNIPNCFSVRPLNDSPVPFVTSPMASVHCLPEIFVAGFAKCGTSALFGLLALHPSAIGPSDKEHCIRNDDLITYLQLLPSPDEIGNKTQVSGCFYRRTFEMIFDILKPDPMKLLFIIRNYADLAWASYNFWCQPQLDAHCRTLGGWVTEEHYRSPEMFHELILAQQKGAGHPLWVPTLLRDAPKHFQKKLQYFRTQVGDKNMFVMDSEELDSDPDQVWRYLAQFGGFSQTHPNMKEFKSRRYNTQDKKGGTEYIAKDAHQKNVYAVSGNRPMLNESRKILNEAWKPDCVWLKATFDLPTLTCEIFNISHMHSKLNSTTSGSSPSEPAHMHSKLNSTTSGSSPSEPAHMHSKLNSTTSGSSPSEQVPSFISTPPPLINISTPSPLPVVNNQSGS